QGAIINPEWRSRRIDFQPYPFPSYTTELVGALQQTLIGENVDFLHALNPQDIGSDLVDDSFVKKALQYVGGPQSFGLSLDLARQEYILL
ncbi:MAG: ABC transporter substrate-binding protein, partial [Merismopedia sp. SIO2A8]|nr:ABC transporter substrate-binding protein [Merismopedia sp. SIO2A8]